MNNKTAKILNDKAKEFAKEKGMPVKWAQKELKRLWKATPHDIKHKLGI